MSQVIPQTVLKSMALLARPRLSPMLVVIVLMSLLSPLFVWSRSMLSALNMMSLPARAGSAGAKSAGEGAFSEVAFLSRDERIETLARNELGLRDPAPGQLIRVE